MELKLGEAGEGVGTGHYYSGLLSLVLACISSGFAGVYLESLLKQLDANVWIANMQLQLFSLPIAALAMLKDFHRLYERGPFSGWTSMTWVVVLLNALGGFMVTLTMKYADNILKTLAASLSLVMNCLLSAVFFSIAVTEQRMAGIALVISATVLYNASHQGSNIAVADAHSAEATAIREKEAAAHAAEKAAADKDISAIAKAVSALEQGMPGTLP